MDELETRMRDVLLQLALTSSARIGAYDSSGGGTPDYTLVDDRGDAKLGRGDAPHLLYAQAWDRARGAGERERILEEAKAALAHIRRSSADPTRVESKADRDQRILKEGQGFPAREVAIAFRCGVTDIWKVREANGRDIEFGEQRQNGREMSLEERNAEILRLCRRKLSTREIATRLNIARASVRYVLARQAPGKPNGLR